MTRSRGQATVELALVVPFVVTLVLSIVQVAVTVRNQLAVESAARAGARAASASVRPGAAADRAAFGAITLRPLDVVATSSAGAVTVTVEFVDHTTVPLIGALLPDVTLQATVTMLVEPAS